MRFLILISILVIPIIGSAACDDSILATKNADKSKGMNFFEAGEYFSKSEVQSDALRLDIELSQDDLCYIDQTFINACSSKNSGKVAGLAKNFSCNNILENDTAQHENNGGGPQVDCTRSPHSTFCDTTIPAGDAGEGKRYLATNSFSTPDAAVNNVHATLTDATDNNDTDLAYGDLMYHYDDIKSPADADTQQVQSQQDALIAAVNCDEAVDISQCNLATPDGVLELMSSNPEDELAALNHLETEQACTETGCSGDIFIGLGDLKEYYAIRPDGTTLQDQHTFGGGGGIELPEEDQPENVTTPPEPVVENADAGSTAIDEPVVQEPIQDPVMPEQELDEPNLSGDNTASTGGTTEANNSTPNDQDTYPDQDFCFPSSNGEIFCKERH